MNKENKDGEDKKAGFINSVRESINGKVAFGSFSIPIFLALPVGALLLFVILIFPERIAMVVHGSGNLSAGKITDGNLSNQVVKVSFWTPKPCETSKNSDDISCTHNDLVKFYINASKGCNEKEKQQFRYKMDCKKTLKRIKSGYYFFTKDQLDALESDILSTGVSGYNRFEVVGAGADSPVKAGLWWELTYSKSNAITEDRLKTVINNALMREKPKEDVPVNKLIRTLLNEKSPSPPDCKEAKEVIAKKEFKKNESELYLYTGQDKESSINIFTHCWSVDSKRAPLISVYAEIIGR